jgi:transcriptional regulator with PAS, ATPase and Fis domain
MSKKALRKYVKELKKEELEDQVLELYDRLKEVREFYNFVFNPKEDKMLDEAKFKVSKEYFPPGRRKAKKRRSVAQKFIKEFIKLGVEPAIIADLMVYNIEVAQTYTADHTINQDAFYKSMLKSFKEAIVFIDENGLQSNFNHRLDRIVSMALEQNWINGYALEEALLDRVA